MNKIDFTAYPLIPGALLKGAQVMRGAGRADMTFLKVEGDPKVYVADRRSPISMLKNWSTNRSERAAWAKLAGVKFKDVEKARADKKKADQEADRKYRERSLRAEAKKLGLRVVK